MDDEALLERPAAKTARNGKSTDETGDPLPQPGDEYRAIGRNGNKPEPMLCFILQDQSLEIFSYASLTRVRQHHADGKQRLVLRFVETTVTEVHLDTRGAHDLAPSLRQHRVPWIRELPSGRDFIHAGPVILHIRIAEDAN